jgi:hypothetical protein
MRTARGPETSAAPARPGRGAGIRLRRRAAIGLLSAGVISWAGWLGWRAERATDHVLSAILLTTELVGLLGVVLTAACLVRSGAGPAPMTAAGADRSDEFRRRHASATGCPTDAVTRASVAAALRRVWRRDRTPQERAGDLVLLEGVRRGVAVLVVCAALLLGISPVGRPPALAVAALLGGLAATSVATWILSGGALRPGDRLAWSFAAAGLSVGGGEDDTTSAVPLRWVGVVGAVVALNVAIALRGVSDRWTHGLAPMARDERTATMVLALVLVVAALWTMRSLAPPAVGDRLPRGLEERSARRTALAAAALAGLVGLAAGVATQTVDAGSPAPERAVVQPVAGRDGEP